MSADAEPTVEIEVHHLGGESELFKLAPGDEQEFLAQTSRFVVRALDEGDLGHSIAQVPLARVDGQLVPATAHPDAAVAVEEGELYHVDSGSGQGTAISSSERELTTAHCGCGEYAVHWPTGQQPPEIDVVCPECRNHFGHGTPPDEPCPCRHEHDGDTTADRQEGSR